MAEFSWAYIDSAAVLSSSGPTGSIQYRVADSGGNTAVSGSSNFVYHTASSLLAITGSVEISGTLTANQYNVNVIDKTVTNISASGDTIFGDTADDTHQFTGSVYVNGPLSASANISASAFYGDGSTLSNVGEPAGSNTEIQYNNAGAFGASALARILVVGGAAAALAITGSVIVTGSALNTTTVIDGTHVSSSLNISGSSFYGDGSTLSNITATNISGAMGQFNTTSGLLITSGNAYLGDGASDITTIASQLTASQGALFNEQVMIVDDKNLVFGNQGDSIIRYDEAGSDALVVSGSSTGLWLGGGSVIIDSPVTQITGTLELTGSTQSLLTLHTRDADELKEIAFLKDGAPAAAIQINDSEHLFIENENAKDIILRADNLNALRVIGSQRRVIVGTVSKTTANAQLDVEGNAIVSGTLTTTDDINLLDDKKLNLGDSADALIEYDSDIGRLAISGSATGIELMGGSIGMDYPGGTVVSGTAGGAGSFLALNSSHQVVVATPAGGGSAFPHTGDAVISGTLDVSGSIEKLGYIQLGVGSGDQDILISALNLQIDPSTGDRDINSINVTPLTTPIFRVEFDDTIRIDESYYTSGSDGIVIAETGDYQLSYNLNYALTTPNSTRACMKTWAIVNFSGSVVSELSGTVMPYTHAYCYLRGDGGTNWGGTSGGNATVKYGTNSVTTIVSASAGDTINVCTSFFGGATSGYLDVTILGNQSWITIEKI